MNKLRIFAFADEAGSALDVQVAALKRNSLEGVELRNVAGVNVSDLSPEQAREIRRTLDGEGLRVWSIGSPLGKIGVEDDFPAHLDKLRRTLELACILGAEHIRAFSFYIPRDDDPERWRGAVIDRLGRMLELAREAGATLCHENEKGIYGDVAVRCAALHEALPELAGVFDPANFIQSGQDPWAAWELLAPKVAYLHIKDALPDGRVVPTGEGCGQVPRILAAYRARGGENVTLEPHLTVFDGLRSLERAGDESVVGSFVYESADAAFDAACAALRKYV